MLARMRIWLPDAPGVLGAVAAEIGALGSNVLGLEVLERESGVAIDELVVELPDEAGAVDAVCRRVSAVPGVGVEDVTELFTEAPDREDTVLAAATAIVTAATPDETVRILTDQLTTLFSLSWLALADRDWQRFVEIQGEDVPSVQWVAAFAEGSRSGTDPANDTIGSGVFVEPLPGAALTVCGGRPAPIRRRERREIAMLTLVAARFVMVQGDVGAASN